MDPPGTPSRIKFSQMATAAPSPIHESSVKSSLKSSVNFTLPPRPTRSSSVGNSLVSSKPNRTTLLYSRSISSLSGTSEKVASEPGDSNESSSQSFDFKSSGKSRDGLKDVVRRSRRSKSLTQHELTFLGKVLDEGEDEHVDLALRSLSNTDVFFDLYPTKSNESEVDKEDNSFHGKEINKESNEGNDHDNCLLPTKNNNALIPIDPDSSMKPSKLSERSDSLITRVSLFNTETVYRDDGIVDLQQYNRQPDQKLTDALGQLNINDKDTGPKNSSKDQLNEQDMSALNHEEKIEEDETELGRNDKRISLLEPESPRSRSLSMGSSLRKSVILERKKSTAQRDMWLAHQSGLAVSNEASRHNLKKSKILRSPSFKKSISNHSRNHSRNDSLMSQSIADLVEFGGVKLDKEGFGDIFRSEGPNGKVSLRGSSPVNRRHIRRSSFSKSVSGLIKPKVLNRVEKNLDSSSSNNVDPLNDSAHILEADIPKLRSEPIFTGGSIPATRKCRNILNFQRQESTGALSNASSIPGIQMATHIRGDSTCSSLNLGDSINTVDMEQFSKQWLAGGSPDENELKGTNKSNEASNQAAWSVPVPKISPQKDNDHDENAKAKRTTFMRQASVGDYLGVGIEVSDIHDTKSAEAFLNLQSLEQARKTKSLFSSLTTQRSYDDSFFNATKGLDKQNLLDLDENDFNRSLSFEYCSNRDIFKSIIDKEFEFNSLDQSFDKDQSKSFEIDTSVVGQSHVDDAWKVLVDEYALGYGYQGLPFLIIGTSADDVASHPHVLSPPLMESISNFLPWSVSEQNYWMKYSLIRDGASFHSLLQHVRGSSHTLIAIETTDGEVFGSFTSTPW